MTEIKKKGLSRRSVLKGAAASVGAAIGSGAITGFPTYWAQASKDITITHVGSIYTTNPTVSEQANKDLGFTVQMQTLDNTTQINRMLTQPETIDVADFGNTNMGYFKNRGILMPIPVSEYRYWDKTVPLFTQGTYADGNPYSMQGYAPIKSQFWADQSAQEYSLTPTDWLVGIPIMYNADTLGVRPDLVPHKVESWGDLFNSEFAGKVALQDGVNVGVPDAAVALEAAGLMTYVDKGNMTREEIDKTIDLLIELKRAGHFRSFWTNFDQSVQLMASGEVVLQSMFAPAVTEVRTRGIECQYLPLKEGSRGWYIFQSAMAHLDGGDKLRRDCVMEYMNWCNSGFNGVYFSRQGFYSSVPDLMKEQLSENDYGYWYEGKAATADIIDPFGKVMEKAGAVRDGGSLWDRMGNVGIWNTLMDEDRYLVRRWQDFMAA
ncbi:MAG: PotD/PotF family extracellular solute-binding protein [Candidatus Devosia phytovorans]|uniref:PotD/PotF family extracellular solute-binding protein n=1 Tax=Candidatus Devosia phytovorans TaxID=3121372 RepID=A0AAJ5VXG2_9HYPH|nr:PotD/PotF family extracellular solute-binding protein [Devosia sp.]WEK05283.1 MAG: PotD/PotF family extracellular solute-binding protein [Devosia sp.]